MQIETLSLLDRLQSPDANMRYKTWRAAGPTGASAVKGLADLMTSPDKGIARSARGALETIAYYAARPGAANDAHAVSMELLQVAVADRPVAVRAQALYLLGFTGDGRVVPTVVKLLASPEVREEARIALERIPGSASLNALKKAETTVPADFQPNIRQSLHNRELTPQTVGTLPAR
jgi:HEAT repeat protein